MSRGSGSPYTGVHIVYLTMKTFCINKLVVLSLVRSSQNLCPIKMV
jgi:hypothetical protein